jgi:hypothetical protein
MLWKAQQPRKFVPLAVALAAIQYYVPCRNQHP